MTRPIYNWYGRSPNSAKVIMGERHDGEPVVWVMSLWTTRGLLRLLRHYPVHSQKGFDWGSPSDGAADLALALLIRQLHAHPRVGGELGYTGRVFMKAWGLHKAFMDEVVVNLPTAYWQLPAQEVGAWIERHLAYRPALPPTD